MSIATQIERIRNDRNKIRTKLVALGIATNTDDLDQLATSIEGITKHSDINADVIEGNSYTIPKGYHDGTGKVNALTDTTGEVAKYKTQSKTVTPEKKTVTVTSDEGYYALSSVTVTPIPDNFADITDTTATASDVLSGKVFVDADGTVTAGTMPNNGKVTAVITTANNGYTIPKGYHNGEGTVGVRVSELEEVTPSDEEITVEGSSGKFLRKVVVNKIPDTHVNISKSTIPATQANSAYDEGGNNDNECNAVFYVDKTNTSEVFAVKRTTAGAGASNKDKHYVIPPANADGSAFTDIYIENLIAGNIKAGSNIAGIDGTFTADANAVTANILEGKTAYVNGAKVTGTMVDHGDNGGGTFNGLTNTVFVIPPGYHENGEVSLDSSIENALAAI